MPAAAQRTDSDVPIFEHERLAAVERLDPKLLRENRARSKNSKENDAHPTHTRKQVTNLTIGYCRPFEPASASKLRRRSYS